MSIACNLLINPLHFRIIHGKSIVLKDNMFTPAGIKGFNCKPVLRAVNKTTTGSVEGLVTDTASVLLENAEDA